MQLYQIILAPYKKIPSYLSEQFSEQNSEMSSVVLYDDTGAEFMRQHDFDIRIIQAFENTQNFVKARADLLRFCVLSAVPGVYMDVDLTFAKPLRDLNIPHADTVTCIGAHTPRLGITPLPAGEFAYGFIICNTPDPLLLEYINETTPEEFASTTNPYAMNIQGLYVFFCRRWNVDHLEPFRIYTDPPTQRTYYFIKETKIAGKYEMHDYHRNILIHSNGHINHQVFM